MADSLDRSDVIEQVKNSPHQKVKVAIADIDGVLRGKYMHKNKFLSAAESGFGFCNVVFGWDIADVCYDNSEYTGWHTGYPDAEAEIDLDTYREIPWEDNVPFFLADFRDKNGDDLQVCPRRLLKKVIRKAENMGFKPMIGCEYEWFNFHESPQSLNDKATLHPSPITPGMFGYSLLRASYNESFFSDLMGLLERFDIPLEGLHTETGPGVYEAAIMYGDALTAADRGVLFKTATKEIAYRHEIMPSFMARWNKELPGCSGHIHQSLWDEDKKTNLFFDDKDPHKMSEIYKSYLAGLIHLLPEILPFFAPNINSYKRLVEGFWAPTRSNWGVENRTTAFRAIPGSSKSTRLEVRVPGSDINSYLAIAACIAAGLYGVEKELSLDSEPVTGNAYAQQSGERLASTLAEATAKLKQSEVAKDLFGETFVDHFARTREWEVGQFERSITSWEMQRYFELI